MAKIAAIVQADGKFFRDRKKANFFLAELEPGLTAFQIFLERLKRLKFINQIFVLTSDLPEDDPLVDIAERCHIKQIQRFSHQGVLEKKPSYQRHHWGQNCDTYEEMLIGSWLEQWGKLPQFDHFLLIQPTNLLFDPAVIQRGLKFHIDNEFDYTYPDDINRGTYFAFYTRDLLRGLLRTDSLRCIRGGIPSAIAKKLYPFNFGVIREEIFRDPYYFDLILNSRRMVDFFKKTKIYNIFDYVKIREAVYAHFGDYFHFPRILHLEPSSTCDMKCFFCPHPKIEKPRGEMKWETYEKVLAECTPYDDLIFRFSGFGEPALHPELVKMVDAATRQNIVTHVITNGSKWSAEFCASMINVGLKMVTFGIEGHTPESYARFRPEMPFAKFQTHIQNLVKIKELGPDLPNIIVQIVKFKETDPHLQQYLEYFNLRSNNIPGQNFFPFVHRPNSIEWVMIHGYSRFLEQLEEREEIDYTPFFRTPCKHELDRAMIFADGSLVQCFNDFQGHRPEVNLAGGGIGEFWRSAIKRERIEKQLRGEWAGVEPCSHCQDWYQN